MEKKINRKAALSDIFNWKLEIPGWLATIMTITIVAAISQKWIAPFVLVAIIILFILIWIFQSRSPQAPKTTEIILSDEDAPEYKITLSDFPSDVTPTLLKIADREEAKKYDKDGVKEILFIAGNLVFKRNGVEVNHFSSPVRITYNYSKEDEARMQARAQQLLDAKTISSMEEFQFFPVYLYSNPEKPEINIWKPFQNYSIDPTNRTMTIEFMEWGDQQAGGGTRP